MAELFHLSFWVDDLERSKRFYAETLGCRIGRDSPSWCDLDFFGHQVTIHQARQPQGELAGAGPSKRTLDHFGVILSKQRWQALLRQLEARQARFRVRPRQEDVGQPTEHGKFVLVDPDGLGLEFKYYCALEQTLQRA